MGIGGSSESPEPYSLVTCRCRTSQHHSNSQFCHPRLRLICDCFLRPSSWSQNWTDSLHPSVPCKQLCLVRTVSSLIKPAANAPLMTSSPVGSYKRCSRDTSVDLPLPLSPTSAVSLPGCSQRSTPDRAELSGLQGHTGTQVHSCNNQS